MVGVIGAKKRSAPTPKRGGGNPGILSTGGVDYLSNSYTLSAFKGNLIFVILSAKPFIFGGIDV
jgi:hypothetical protein